MMENVIVTVRMDCFCCDMELPVNLRLKELSVMLLEALQSMEPGEFDQMRSILLLHDGKALDDHNATLDDYGILSGNVVDLVEGG